LFQFAFPRIDHTLCCAIPLSPFPLALSCAAFGAFRLQIIFVVPLSSCPKYYFWERLNYLHSNLLLYSVYFFTNIFKHILFYIHLIIFYKKQNNYIKLD
jgi:hypothetical protein